MCITISSASPVQSPNQPFSRISLVFPLIPHTPQFVFTITRGSKSATSHLMLPNSFSPGVTIQSNSPATPGAFDSDLTSLSTSAGENPVTKIGHFVASSSGMTGPHSVGETIWRTGLPFSSTEVGEGNPNPGEKRTKASVYGSNVSRKRWCTSM